MMHTQELKKCGHFKNFDYFLENTVYHNDVEGTSQHANTRMKKYNITDWKLDHIYSLTENNIYDFCQT